MGSGGGHSGHGPQPKNVLLGDKIRHWSRIRVHQHFFPHYLDSSLVFDAPKSMLGREWTSENIVYILLSRAEQFAQPDILSAQSGRDPRRRQTGDQEMARLGTRQHRIPHGPQGPARLAHAGQGRRLAPHRRPAVASCSCSIPTNRSWRARFALSEEAIDLSGPGPFRVTQHYPVSRAAPDTGLWG